MTLYKKRQSSSNLNFVLELYKIWNLNWPMTKEGSYLRGQESSNGFKFSNSCIVEYLNGFGPIAKKWGSYVFKTLWLDQ